MGKIYGGGLSTAFLGFSGGAFQGRTSICSLDN